MSDYGCGAAWPRGPRELSGGRELVTRRVGPGAYSLEGSGSLSARSAPGHSFSRESRFRDDRRRKGAPRPPADRLSRSQIENLNFREFPSHGFSKEQRFLHTPGPLWDDLRQHGPIHPGPGQTIYDDTVQSNAPPVGPKFTIGERREGQDCETVPGPGSYTPAVLTAKATKASPRCVFPSSPRMKQETVATKIRAGPGPGLYPVIGSTRTGEQSLTGAKRGFTISGRRGFSFCPPEARTEGSVLPN
mmetsp:Transcript_94942/g.273300  ORF Transcript_94942/g.273300 Transcript_94942/m.273300 type:complete len:246 (-) Transcript_94942:66-803(-)